jgi:hypothetical protein
MLEGCSVRDGAATWQEILVEVGLAASGTLVPLSRVRGCWLELTGYTSTGHV